MKFKFLILFSMLFNFTFIFTMKKGDVSLLPEQSKGLALLLSPLTQDVALTKHMQVGIDPIGCDLVKAIQLGSVGEQASSDRKEDELISEEERKQIAAATAVSLDKIAEIAEFRKRVERNEQLRMDPKFRLIPNIFENPRIFHVRSLRQPNDWMCGHYVLFNSRFLQFGLLGQNFNPHYLFANNLLNFFSPESYKSTLFFEFYREASIKAYQKEPEELKRDPFSGELCVDPDFTGKNLLESDHFSWVTAILQTPHFYVLRNFRTGIDIVPAIDQMSLGEKIVKQGGSESYLTNLRNNLNGKFALHFACFAGGNHWILVSVVNCFNGMYSPAIIIMDSFNNNLSHHPEMIAYISYLENIFLRHDVRLKPIVEIGAFPPKTARCAIS